MGYQLATLAWYFAFVSIWIVCIACIVYFAKYDVEARNKYLVIAVGLIFVEITLIWSCWVLYPLTAMGMN